MLKNLNGELTGNDLMSDLIHKATVAFNSMTEDQQKVVLDLQRHSWLKGHKHVDTEPAAREFDRQDISYYLARVEGQLARMDELLAPSAPMGGYKELVATVRAAKAFLDSLRNALDPRRIDVA